MRTLSRILIGLLVVVVLAISSLAVALSHSSACGTAPSVVPRQAMKAALHRCYGAADVVRVETVERPVPADEGVLVRVHATSVNPLDWHTMHGEPYLMRIGSGWGTPTDPSFGTDFAGIVESVGKLVTQFKPGDEVFGIGHAAFAQYLRVPQGASVALKPGQKVLINGAGGGVGTFAVQIAKAMGAEVTAVTNPGSIPLMRSLGADHVIDYTREDFTANAVRYDLILDMSGNHPLSAYRRVMTPTGTYVLAGDTGKGAWGGPLAGFGKALIVAKFVNQKLVPFIAQTNPADLAILADMLQKGQVKPVIDRQYRLEQIAEAIGYQESGHARGKVVVTME
jgi:NADPH:quinone reductase-like Zn-dependent oxidoreductase